MKTKICFDGGSINTVNANTSMHFETFIATRRPLFQQRKPSKSIREEKFLFFESNFFDSISHWSLGRPMRRISLFVSVDFVTRIGRKDEFEKSDLRRTGDTNIAIGCSTSRSNLVVLQHHHHDDDGDGRETWKTIEHDQQRSLQFGDHRR